MKADLVVFDPETVEDRATVQDPGAPPVGIPYVVVNGTLVVDQGQPTGARPGRRAARQAAALSRLGRRRSGTRHSPGRPALAPARGLQPLAELRQGQRPAHEVTLGQVAAEAPQQLPGRGVLDTLGYHDQPQVVPELDGRAHDQGVLGGARDQVDHEGLVDLQLVDPQALELRQADDWPVP